MTRDEFTVATAQAARRHAPHLTPRQAVLIAERRAKIEDTRGYPLWELTDPGLIEEYTRVGIETDVTAAPELFRAAPTVEQYVNLLLAALEAKLGRPASATERLNASRAAAGLTPDDLLAKVPHDTKLPDIAAPRPAPKAVTDDIEALDAEAEKRTGKKTHEMLPSERIRWHNALKNERRREESVETNRTAALADAGGDLSNLPPAERMSRFRAAERAKASNRP